MKEINVLKNKNLDKLRGGKKRGRSGRKAELHIKVLRLISARNHRQKKKEEKKKKGKRERRWKICIEIARTLLDDSESLKVSTKCERVRICTHISACACQKACVREDAR